MTSKAYDAIVIGAGMSGMAAAIRLAMFDKKVLLLEKHVISGGLNSYYRRAKREFDVGLHALTNFAGAKEKNKPLKKLLKQLRIPYEKLQLSEQSHSLIAFPEHTLRFDNDINSLREDIFAKFPNEIDGFNKLTEYITDYNDVDLNAKYQSAKDLVREYIKSEQLLEMIFCPLMIYGSAWEHDMDFSQFAIMFKAIYLEGFSRPNGGVRTIINLLLEKLESTGAEVRFKTGVASINTKDGKVTSITTEKGEVIETQLVISSAGYPETMKMVADNANDVAIGKMSFIESIAISDKKPKDFDQNATIIFYNNDDKYHYQMPEKSFDNQSAVLCLPNNFKDDDYDEGILRITLMANYKKWDSFSKEAYLAEKGLAFSEGMNIISKFLPGITGDNILFKDVFSPTTIKRYTGHFGGTVYGSTTKTRDGSTIVEGLKICGTDQGFLGIIGSALSGISIANLYGLQGGGNK